MTSNIICLCDYCNKVFLNPKLYDPYYGFSIDNRGWKSFRYSYPSYSFCSKMCRKEAKKILKICEFCEKKYQANSKKQRFCSNRCTQLFKSDHQKIIDNKKKCSRCKECKKLNEFPYLANTSSNLSSHCRSCKSKAWNKYYSNPENRKKKSKKAKEYNNSIVGKLKNTQRRKKYMPIKNLKEKEKADSNPMFRLNRNMRARIYMALRDNKNGQSWEILTGYSLKQLKKHLEKQFTNGMNWNNYGEWHIDHIIPHSVFNFSHPDHIDFKRCWALKNLRPLWGAENIAKKDSLEKPFQPRLPI